MDFGGNADLYPDPGLLWWNFVTPVLAVVEVLHRGFRNSPKTRKPADFGEGFCAVLVLLF